MRALVAAALLIACGGDPAAVETDAGIDGAVATDADASVGPRTPCWPHLTRTPKGTVVLGTGTSSAFEPMPEVLPLEYGVQGGFHLMAHVRMSGFAPGNAKDVFDPGNPHTRVRAYFADSGIPLNYYAYCPYRSAYVPGPSDDYQFPEAVPIIFETCWHSDQLLGKRIRVEVEVMDGTGGYARDVKIITAGTPLGFYALEPGVPGCVHDYRPGLETGYPSRDSSPASR